MLNRPVTAPTAALKTGPVNNHGCIFLPANPRIDFGVCAVQPRRVDRGTDEDVSEVSDAPVVLSISDGKKVVGNVIYGLCDLDGKIFYVGKTVSLKKRLQSHSEARTDNARMKERIKGRKDWAVIILRLNPEDLAAAELEEIRAHEPNGLLNIILSDSGVWDMYKDSPKPWVAKSGKRSPYSTCMNHVSPETRKALRKRLKEMTEAERCCAELDFYVKFQGNPRNPFLPWFNDTIVDMVKCMRSAGVEVTINV